MHRRLPNALLIALMISFGAFNAPTHAQALSTPKVQSGEGRPYEIADSEVWDVPDPIRQLARRLNVEGPQIEEFILVGLSYGKGEDGGVSRQRDYTPTPNGPSTASPNSIHGTQTR